MGYGMNVCYFKNALVFGAKRLIVLTKMLKRIKNKGCKLTCSLSYG